MLENEGEINALTCCITLIEQYRKPHIFSNGIMLISIMLILFLAITNTLSLFWLLTLASIIVLGIVEMIYAIRVGFDLTLLKKLANKNNSVELGLKEIDSALTQLRLLPSDKTDRNLDTRLRGCIYLFKTQVGLCVLQCLIVVSAAVLYL